MAEPITNGKFVVDLRNLIRLAKDDVRAVCDRAVLSLFTKIVQRSPVDTGRFRSNWNFSFGSPNLATSESTGGDPVAEMSAAIAGSADGTVGKMCWLANGLPYGPVLEYGGYPNPPKHGSWVKGQGWVIKSTGGYSKQAPQGMVRITLLEFGEVLRVAASEAKRIGA